MLAWLCPALPPTVDPLIHESRALLLVGLVSSFKAEDSCLRRVRCGVLLSGSRLLHACIGRADKTYTTSYGCLQHILKTGGVQLLYKGVFANSVRAIGSALVLVIVRLPFCHVCGMFMWRCFRGC